MGKFVVIPDHPSNQFFKRFKNACFYQTEAEAMQQIRQTAASIPQADPLVKELAWPEANKRLLQLIERVLSHGSLSS